jgi:hypothetical protein
MAAAILSAAAAGCAPAPLKLSDSDRSTIRRIERAEPDQRDALRARLIDAHPEWSEDAKSAVRAGEISNGMTPEQVVCAWGFPDRRTPDWWKGPLEREQSEYRAGDSRVLLEVYGKLWDAEWWQGDHQREWLIQNNRRVRVLPGRAL